MIIINKQSEINGVALRVLQWMSAPKKLYSTLSEGHLSKQVSHSFTASRETAKRHVGLSFGIKLESRLLAISKKENNTTYIKCKPKNEMVISAHWRNTV